MLNCQDNTAHFNTADNTEKSYFPVFCTMAYATDFSKVEKGAVMYFESRHLCTLNHLSYGINSKSTQMQRNIMPKNDNSNAKIVCLLLLQHLY